MARFIEISLEKRGANCLARLLDDEAPQTCDIVWEALPLKGDAWHAKYAMNEVYCLVPPIQGDAPGLENSTVVPIPRDVLYWYFPASHIGHNFMKERGFENLDGVVDLAIFYGRNNFLFNPATGPTPGNIFATIVDNFDEMVTACKDIHHGGSVDEHLVFRRGKVD